MGISLRSQTRSTDGGMSMSITASCLSSSQRQQTRQMQQLHQQSLRSFSSTADGIFVVSIAVVEIDLIEILMRCARIFRFFVHHPLIFLSFFL
jgi:hypothetical protein